MSREIDKSVLRVGGGELALEVVMEEVEAKIFFLDSAGLQTD